MFVGCGAPRGRDLDIPGRQEAAEHIHIGIDWLASVSFGHVTKVGKRVIVLGGGNTAMDCCRSARRLGGEDVKVIVRSGFDDMKASPWEKEDAQHEGIPIINMHVPKAFVHEGGQLTGMTFEIVRAEHDDKGRRKLVPTGEPDAFFACDEVLIAVGQENAFPWIERNVGIDFDQWGLPLLREGIPGFDDDVAPGMRLDPRGRLATVDDAASIRQALLLLLSTRPGERVNRPAYGCHLWRLAFEGADDTTAGLAIHYVTQAVETWEKRVKILEVVAQVPEDDPSLLEVRMTYRIQSTLATDAVAVAVPTQGGRR